MIRALVILGIAALLSGVTAAVAFATQGAVFKSQDVSFSTAKKNAHTEKIELSSSKTAPRMPLSAQSSTVQATFAGIDLAKMMLSEQGYHQVMDDGRNIIFTVDAKLQKYADGLFDKYQVPAGAAVLVSSRTGRIIALSQERRIESAAGSSTVAFDASPPAASLFKIVTTAALVEEAGLSLETETCYSGGSSELKMQHLLDKLPANHACVSLTTALGQSINAVYAKLSDRYLNRSVLDEYARRFGFNRPVEFDVPIPESTAQIPDDRLERARTAAGFWHTHVSPLHAAMIAQSLAQGGAMLRPYIVDRVEDRNGAIIFKSKTKYLGQTVSKETAKRITEAMLHTTKQGTARKSFKDPQGRAYIPGIAVSGKTGTLTGTAPYRAYTWFMGVAPENNPEVAIAVLVVNEPKWRIKAPQVAALLLKAYFDKAQR